MQIEDQALKKLVSCMSNKQIKTDEVITVQNENYE